MSFVPDGLEHFSFGGGPNDACMHDVHSRGCWPHMPHGGLLCDIRICRNTLFANNVPQCMCTFVCACVNIAGFYGAWVAVDYSVSTAYDCNGEVRRLSLSFSHSVFLCTVFYTFSEEQIANAQYPWVCEPVIDKSGTDGGRVRVQNRSAP